MVRNHTSLEEIHNDTSLKEVGEYILLQEVNNCKGFLLKQYEVSKGYTAIVLGRWW
jgi:hypothetical protein